MARKRLIWQLFPNLWLIAIIAIAAITIYITQTFKQFYLKQIAAELKYKALIIRNQLDPKSFQSDDVVNDEICRQAFKGTDTRLTIVDSSGIVLCDSEKNSEFMENHQLRPEISKALSGSTGTSVRYSQTLHSELLYVAIPVYCEDKIVGTIRTSVSIASINEALVDVYWKVGLGGLAAVILIVLMSISASRRVIKPLENIRLIAHRFAHGDLNIRLPKHESLEIGELADSMNQMASQLDDRIKAVIRQRNEQQAVLSSMVEGVLAVDLNEHLINLNLAAEKMLGVSAESAKGKYIHEVIRNTQIQEFVKKVLTRKEMVESEIIMNRGSTVYLQAHGTILLDMDGQEIGAVMVLNDITRLRHLENVRRDFVANVSHELKTPITSIKGFVETLQDGALENREDADRFLSIIVKQAERLNGIIEDLLSLSRIEEQEKSTSIELTKNQIKKVLESSIQTCEQISSAKNIVIELKCEGEIEAEINSDLLQQAIVNLLDNAIKYSPAGETIKVEAFRDATTIKISVIDNGPGISKEHLPRLFERFYRVDKARSRQLGGTGLGLAIVKHIALAHHGDVSVESTPGKGSTFIIEFPT